MRVAVYYNLHRKCLSVKALEGPNKGRVIDHRHHVALVDVTFKVSEAGRQRVLRDKRKNVHAFIVGRLATDDDDLLYGGDFDNVTYNPYRYSSFVRWGDKAPVTKASVVEIVDREIYAVVTA